MRYFGQACFVAGVCYTLTLLAACGKSEPPPQTTTPPVAAPTTPPPAAPAVTVTALELGKQIGADKRVTQQVNSFAPKDTIYATVVTTGSASSATLTAKWTYQDGQVVHESTQTIAPTGTAATEFHIVKPDGWPTGTYKVEVSLNGRSAATKEFEVKG
jgi:hypothetical protein